MPFMTSVRRHLSDKGRTKRSEFWLVFLLLVLATMLAYRYARFFVPNANWLLLFFVLIAPFLWLYIATARRRCRDIGISVGYSWSTLYAGAGIPYVLLLGSLRSDAAKIPTTNNRTSIHLKMPKNSPFLTLLAGGGRKYVIPFFLLFHITSISLSGKAISVNSLPFA